jgi:putative methyltransferase (TIGR04325 family)
MKDLVKQLIPPLLIKAFKPAPPPMFSSYDAASVACRNEAYEGVDLVKVIIEKNVAFKKKIQSDHILDLSALRTLIGVGLANTQEKLNVLDFGGGGGYHYTLAKIALGKSRSLKWNVVETSAMAREAQRIADTDLKFFDNISDAKNNLGLVDLIFTSSALQYCPNPLEFLNELTEVGAKYIFITRTPFNDSDKSLISIQVSKLSENGPGPLPLGVGDKSVSYPITFVSKQEVEKILNQKYEIRFLTKEDKGTFRAGKNTFDMWGYFCELK